MVRLAFGAVHMILYKALYAIILYLYAIFFGEGISSVWRLAGGGFLF